MKVPNFTMRGTYHIRPASKTILCSASFAGPTQNQLSKIPDIAGGLNFTDLKSDAKFLFHRHHERDMEKRIPFVDLLGRQLRGDANRIEKHVIKYFLQSFHN